MPLKSRFEAVVAAAQTKLLAEITMTPKKYNQNRSADERSCWFSWAKPVVTFYDAIIPEYGRLYAFATFIFKLFHWAIKYWLGYTLANKFPSFFFFFLLLFTTLSLAHALSSFLRSYYWVFGYLVCRITSSPSPKQQLWLSWFSKGYPKLRITLTEFKWNYFLHKSIKTDV